MLEDGFHRLLCIHRDGGLGVSADSSTCGVLPLLKLIAEVLCGLQGDGRSLLVHFHVRVATDASCLRRRKYLCGERIFRYLCGSAYERTLDDEVGDTSRTGALYVEEREV